MLCIITIIAVNLLVLVLPLHIATPTYASEYTSEKCDYAEEVINHIYTCMCV